MTHYSIYNPACRQYEVYVDLAGPARAERPRTGPVVGVEDALPVVPATASLLGYSETPVGVVSQRQRAEVSLYFLAAIGGLLYIILTMKPGDL